MAKAKNPDDSIDMPAKERPNYRVLDDKEVNPDTWVDPTKLSTKVKEKIDTLKKGTSGLL